MSSPMPESTKDALAADAALRQPTADSNPKTCLACGAKIRKPRILRRTSTKDHARAPFWSFCSQDCMDSWQGQFHLPGPSWPVYHVDETGTRTLVAYVIAGKHRVSLDEIENAPERDGSPGASA